MLKYGHIPDLDLGLRIRTAGLWIRTRRSGCGSRDAFEVNWRSNKFGKFRKTYECGKISKFGFILDPGLWFRIWSFDSDKRLKIFIKDVLEVFWPNDMFWKWKKRFPDRVWNFEIRPHAGSGSGTRDPESGFRISDIWIAESEAETLDWRFRSLDSGLRI